MLLVITIRVLCKKGGALKSFNMIEGGYLKNMGAISRGLEINWDKIQFLLHPSNLNYAWSLKLFSVVCCNGRQK